MDSTQNFHPAGPPGKESAMKAQSKQFLIAAVVLLAAAALLFAGYSWYTRPQSFGAVFPMAAEDVGRCEAALHYRGQPEQFISWELTAEQTDRLLARLADMEYRSRCANLFQEPTGVPTTMAASVRITLWRGDSYTDHVELLLSGESLLVNPLFSDRDEPSRIYDPAAGTAQQEDILSFLESCLPDS